MCVSHRGELCFRLTWLTFTVLHVARELESRSTLAGDATLLCFPADVCTAVVLVHAGGSLLCTFWLHCGRNSERERLSPNWLTDYTVYWTVFGFKNPEFSFKLDVTELVWGVKMLKCLSRFLTRSHIYAYLLVTDMPSTPLTKTQALVGTCSVDSGYKKEAAYRKDKTPSRSWSRRPVILIEVIPP